MDHPSRTGDETIQILLEGGHVVTGDVTQKTFEYLCEKLHTNDGGYIRVDEEENHEVLIVIGKIVAVRYLR